MSTRSPLPQSFLDLLPFGVAVVEAAGHLVQWNRWLARHLTHPPQTGRPLTDWVAPGGQEAVAHALEQALRLGVTTLLSHRVHPNMLLLGQPDDPQHPLPHNVHCLPWREEGFHGAVLLVQDLSDRLRSERELREQLAFFRLLAAVGEAVTGEASLAQGTQRVAELLAEHFQADHVAVYLHRTDGVTRLVPIARYGRISSASLPLETGAEADGPPWVAVWVWQRGTGLVETLEEGEGVPLYAPLAPDTRSVMARLLAPRSQGAPLGVVVLESRRPHAFDEGHLQRLALLSEHLAMGLALNLAYERERRLRRLAETLREIGMRLAAEHEPRQVMQLILESVAEVVPYDAANIMLVEGKVLRIVAARGYERFGVQRKVTRLELPIEEFANLRHIARTHEPLIVHDTRTDPYWVHLETSAHVRSWIGVPILAHERLLGILCLDKTEPGFYTQEHVQALSLFAAQAGLALDNAHQHAEHYRRAITDPLTGLANRRHLSEQLQREVARALRFQRPLSLLMLDIDDFKRYNDTYGHPAGDRVLQAVAEVLRLNTRQMDLAARYGGEEFVVALPETGVRAAARTAERLRRQIAGLHEARDDLRAPVTVSIGVATLPRHARTLEDLILAADVALYHAKHQGKNQVAVYDARWTLSDSASQAA